MSRKHSAALARRWSDPVYREKQIAVLKANNATRGRRKSHPMNEELAAYQKAVELAADQLDGLRSERDQARHANYLAAQAFAEQEARAAELESQLGQTRELLAWLSDAAWPAATILAHLAQIEALDERVRETVQQALAPLDAALAALKAGDA
ncbi:MAG TPA: hypothetical protein VF909_20240 [Roseiflexaceae bacterium]